MYFRQCIITAPTKEQSCVMLNIIFCMLFMIVKLSWFHHTLFSHSIDCGIYVGSSPINGHVCSSIFFLSHPFGYFDYIGSYREKYVFFYRPFSIGPHIFTCSFAIFSSVHIYESLGIRRPYETVVSYTPNIRLVILFLSS